VLLKSSPGPPPAPAYAAGLAEYGMRLSGPSRVLMERAIRPAAKIEQRNASQASPAHGRNRSSPEELVCPQRHLSTLNLSTLDGRKVPDWFADWYPSQTHGFLTQQPFGISYVLVAKCCLKISLPSAFLTLIPRRHFLAGRSFPLLRRFWTARTLHLARLPGVLKRWAQRLPHSRPALPSRRS